MSGAFELLDAVLMVFTAGGGALLSYVAIVSFLDGDPQGAAKCALLAAVNGLVSVAAFRRLRGSVRARAKKEAEEALKKRGLKN